LKFTNYFLPVLSDAFFEDENFTLMIRSISQNYCITWRREQKAIYNIYVLDYISVDIESSLGDDLVKSYCPLSMRTPYLAMISF